MTASEVAWSCGARSLTTASVTGPRPWPRGTHKSVGQGAATTLVAAVDPQLATVGGRYLDDGREAYVVDDDATLAEHPRAVKRWALDPSAAEELWRRSFDMMARGHHRVDLDEESPVHDDRTQVEQRIDRVLGERLRPAVHGERAALDVEVWQAPGEPVPFETAREATYEGVGPGHAWGPPWGTTWFHLRGTVPAGWAGRRVEAVVDLGFGRHQPGFSAEALALRPDGTAVKGLNPRNDWLPVAEVAAGGEAVDVWVEAASNPDVSAGVVGSPLGDVLTAGDAPLYRVRAVDLVVVEEEVRELVHDVEVLDQTMRELPLDQPRRWEVLRALEAAVDAVDLRDVAGSAPAARAALAGALAAPAVASAHLVSAVGHAHVDSAWLWPLRESVRKVARTVANVLHLMDVDDTLVHAMSSAQQFAWVRDHHPDLWARLRERVAQGRFVPVGGMWVESDTNMPSGEALARQLVHGKRFFLDELGVETTEVWLPDSFGYSAGLPQIAAASGSPRLLTQKISWNATNAFPHHTFWWEGIDGTRVFTHFPPVDTYACEVTGGELAHAVATFSEKGVARRSLAPFGHGDGGGGPTREMLARAARTADLEGSPRVSVEAPHAFFDAAIADHRDPQTWVGELYLELHRATYTTQHATKAGNRRSEALLREAELWATTAAVRAPEDYAYPYDALDRLWKVVLLHQFHDILPGTSIAWVHREARATYAAVAAELEGLIADAALALVGDGGDGGDGDRDGGAAVELNAAPHQRAGVPAGGGTVVGDDTGSPAATATADDDGLVLDNGVLRAVVDARGLVVSLVDAATGREAIAPGAGANLLQLHPDLPNRWDAWDVDRHHLRVVRDLVEPESVTDVSADGTAAVRVVHRFGASTVTLTILVTPGSARLDVRAAVDWRESETFLKVAFPLDVRAAVSSAETQFGCVQRPTHTNTSWDVARFEVCAHRYLHVGEGGYGVALVNDSTYGHDVRAAPRAGGGTTTTVRLSLLRAPRYPDPATDAGTHLLGWAVVPGADLVAATREGYAINHPPRRVAGSRTIPPLVSSSSPAVVLSAVKLADDGSGDLVVRLYEAVGSRATTVLALDLDLDLGMGMGRDGGADATLAPVDLLERPLADAAPLTLTPADGGGATAAMTLRPFQMTTLRLRRA